MILIYSLLEKHPAAQVCEELIRSTQGLFTTSVNLLEVMAILSKVYNLEPTDRSLLIDKLALLSDPHAIEVVEVDGESVLAALRLAADEGLDVNDALLLHSTRQWGASRLLTADGPLIDACRKHGIIATDPFDSALRQEIARWEAANLPPKGLARVLQRVHQWLLAKNQEVAALFWSHSGQGSHLP